MLRIFFLALGRGEAPQKVMSAYYERLVNEALPGVLRGVSPGGAADVAARGAGEAEQDFFGATGTEGFGSERGSVSLAAFDPAKITGGVSGLIRKALRYGGDETGVPRFLS